MNLEQKLHERWSDEAALNTLLPAERVTTGRSTDGSLPRATIVRRSRRTVCRTNSGETIEEVEFEMRLRHEQFDDGASIVDEFVASFDRAQFTLSSGANVLNVRRIQEDYQQLEDGSWRFRVEMLARIRLPAP